MNQVKNKERIGFVIIFFLSFHHPNTHFENIQIFYLSLFKSAAKKSVPRYKKYWRGACPPPNTKSSVDAAERGPIIKFIGHIQNWYVKLMIPQAL
jgi:hypothetical protein